MSKRYYTPYLILGFLLAALSLGIAAEQSSVADSNSELAAKTENGDLPFKGNRRPGIIDAPTEEPTGENALLYRRIGSLPPNEYLDLLSEEPKTRSVKDLPLEAAEDSQTEPEAD